MAQEAAATGEIDARITYADLLRANDRYASPPSWLWGRSTWRQTPDWRLLYMRGVALERLRRLAPGRADLETALKLRPDDPELLNYLGLFLDPTRVSAGSPRRRSAWSSARWRPIRSRGR